MNGEVCGICWLYSEMQAGVQQCGAFFLCWLLRCIIVIVFVTANYAVKTVRPKMEQVSIFVIMMCVMQFRRCGLGLRVRH